MKALRVSKQRRRNRRKKEGKDEQKGKIKRGPTKEQTQLGKKRGKIEESKKTRLVDWDT